MITNQQGQPIRFFNSPWDRTWYGFQNSHISHKESLLCFLDIWVAYGVYIQCKAISPAAYRGEPQTHLLRKGSHYRNIREYTELSSSQGLLYKCVLLQKRLSTFSTIDVPCLISYATVSKDWLAYCISISANSLMEQHNFDLTKYLIQDTLKVYVTCNRQAVVILFMYWCDQD